MKLYAKYPTATAAMWFSVFFENAFVSLVKRRFVVRAERFWRSTLSPGKILCAMRVILFLTLSVLAFGAKNRDWQDGLIVEAGSHDAPGESARVTVLPNGTAKSRSSTVYTEYYVIEETNDRLVTASRSYEARGLTKFLRPKPLPITAGDHVQYVIEKKNLIFLIAGKEYMLDITAVRLKQYVGR
jgi:hypothetical protein